MYMYLPLCIVATVDIPEASDDDPADLSLISGRLINKKISDTPTGHTDVVLRNGNKEIIAQQYTGGRVYKNYIVDICVCFLLIS